MSTSAIIRTTIIFHVKLTPNADVGMCVAMKTSRDCSDSLLLERIEKKKEEKGCPFVHEINQTMQALTLIFLSQIPSHCEFLKPLLLFSCVE